MKGVVGREDPKLFPTCLNETLADRDTILKRTLAGRDTVHKKNYTLHPNSYTLIMNYTLTPTP